MITRITIVLVSLALSLVSTAKHVEEEDIMMKNDNIELAINDYIDTCVSIVSLNETIQNTVVYQVSNKNEALGLVAKKHCIAPKITDSIQCINPMLMSIFAPQNLVFLKDYNRYKRIGAIY